VVEVELVGVVDRQAGPKASADRRRRVQHGEGEHRNRGCEVEGEGRAVGGTRPAQEGKGGEHESEEQAARVAHEDPGRREIEQEESRDDAEEADSDQGCAEPAMNEGAGAQGERCHGGDRSRESVDAVDEVHRVAQAHEPQHGERPRGPAEPQLGQPRKRQHIDHVPAERHEDAGRQLQEELQRCGEVAEVVDETRGEDEQEACLHEQEFGLEGEDFAAAIQQGEHRQGEQGDQERHVHPRAAETGQRARVDLPAVRQVVPAVAVCDADDEGDGRRADRECQGARRRQGCQDSHEEDPYSKCTISDVRFPRSSIRLPSWHVNDRCRRCAPERRGCARRIG
jgi:hypothetical protein